MLLIGVAKYKSISTPLPRKDRQTLYYGSVFLGADDVMVILNYFKHDSKILLRFLRHTLQLLKLIFSCLVPDTSTYLLNAFLLLQPTINPASYFDPSCMHK